MQEKSIETYNRNKGITLLFEYKVKLSSMGSSDSYGRGHVCVTPPRSNWA